MLATPVIVQRRPANGPRPINLRRDFRQVLELLDLAFGPILDSNGRRILDTRTNLQYQAPYLMRLNLSNKGFSPGFVWEESGRIIGNISLIQSEVPGRCLIANVAVHPDYRRRGIARMLMQESVEHIQSRHGREIMLQVESSNEAAIQLYRDFGFKEIGSIRRWETTSIRLRNLPAGDGGYEVRPLRGQDWAAAYHLDRACVNPNLNWPAPKTSDHYKSGLRRWITNFLNGRKTESWIIASATEEEHKQQLVGLATINSEWGRPHNLELRVLPQWRGRLERPLLSKLIRRLSYLRGTNILMDHLSGDETVNSLLPEANFQTRRYLTFMHLSIQ
jgi:ribosomal protein S18 acetylase RimI-like enzyme